MKKALLLAASCILIAQPVFTKDKRVTVEASNDYVSKQFDEIKNFDRITVSGMAELEFTQTNDGKTSVTAEIPDNLLDYVEITVERNTLKIDYKKNVSITGINKIKVVACSPVLDGLSVTGNCEVALKGRVVSDNFLLKISGLSNITAEALDCQSLNASISGVGNIEVKELFSNYVDFSVSGQSKVSLSGKANQASYTVTGTSEVKAEWLQTRTATVKVSGIAKLWCHAAQNLDGSVSGNGKLYYGGSPTNVQVSGSSNAMWQI